MSYLPVHVNGAIKRNNANFDVDFPAFCPHCVNDFIPEIIHIMQSPSDNSYFLSILKCQCCNGIVYATIHKAGLQSRGKVKEYYPDRLSLAIPSKIEKLYPIFFRIYQQSSIAELKGLNEVCGMGYRKALESLVKEYTMNKFFSDKENIKKESLTQTINRLKNIPHVFNLSRKITWLWNEQTNMSMKYSDYDISQTKAFVVALCYFIAMENVHKGIKK